MSNYVLLNAIGLNASIFFRLLKIVLHLTMFYELLGFNT